LALPEALGGIGASTADLAGALEQLTHALVPGPVLPTLLGTLLLAPRADRPEVAELLSAVGAGSASIAVASGPGTLTATRNGEGWRVDGRVGPVLGAGGATHLLLAASGPEGPLWYVVPAARAELTTRTPVDFSRPLADVELSIVDISAVAGDASFAARVRDTAGLLAAVEAAAVADWCVATASGHAAVRHQFGRAIGSFQAVKHLCATMLCRAERAVVLTRDAAVAYDEAPDEFPLAAAAAAAVALDAGVDNAKDCVQVLGGIGFTWEHDAHLYLRRALALRALFGPGRDWRSRCAEHAVRGGRRSPRTADPTGTATVSGGGSGGPDVNRGAEGSERAIAGWAVPTIERYGTDAQRERFVGPSGRGEIRWCQLFSEPEAGSDLAGLRTRAVAVPGGWRLSGQKVWSSLAHRAHWGICLARTDPAVAKHRGLTYFLVDMASPGIDVRPLRELTGRTMFNEVFLDDVFVPDDCVLGVPGDGWRLARATLAFERVAMGGGSSLGEEVEALLSTVDSYAPGADPDLADRLGALVADGLAISLLDRQAGDERDSGAGDRLGGAGAAVRKVVGVAHRQAVAEAALLRRGADGSTMDGASAEAVHQFLLTRCLSIAGGTTQILLTLIGERALGLPREPSPER
jgi:alkylation response protein AidB-like acyl-CoA dehydrogenase